MAKLHLAPVATDRPPRTCATNHEKPVLAVAVRIVHQTKKANGVPPYMGFYPVCPECRARAEKAKVPVSQTVTYVPIKH